MTVIGVLLVFGEELATQRLRGILKVFEDIEVVGEARSAIEAMQRVTTAAPDVIIVDAEIPDINGLETTRILKGRGYPGAVIVLSGDIQWLEEALASRAVGYLIRDAPANEVAAIIRRAPEGISSVPVL